MFDNLRNLAGLIGQTKELRQRIDQVQAELARKTVEGDAGAGAVRVVMNGKMEVLRVRLDRPLIAALLGSGDEPAADPQAEGDTQQMIEELIVAAVNDAQRQARDLVQRELAQAAQGLNIPGLEKLIQGYKG